MTLAVLTPFSRAKASPAGERMWRKKLLPVGQVSYKGQVLNFSPDYLGQLAATFSERAYDQVPFQLAPGDNSHTNDPERYRGTVVGMDADSSGLWVTVKATEAGDTILRDNPYLGISARIVEDYERADGKYYPAAVQHVLGTLDPRIPGLGAWEPMSFASEQLAVIDLSGESFSGERKKGDMPDLSPEQQARLARLLDVPEDKFEQLIAGFEAPELTDEELAELAAGLDDGSAQLTDAELEELTAAAQELEAAGELETAGTSLANDDALLAIELATARADDNSRQLAEINRHLDSERYEAERRRLAEQGVPPFIVDMARPLLEGTGHVVELSNGKAADAGAIMRKVLGEFGKASAMLDLSAEAGSSADEPAGVRSDERDQLVSTYKRMTGLR